MKTLVYRVCSLIIATLILVSFNNCSRMESSSSIASLSSSGLPTEKSGIELYKTNCADCHGVLSNSSVKNASSSEISGAIAAQPSMKIVPFLKALSESEIQLISEALKISPNPNPTNPFPGLAKAVQTPQVMNRHLLASRLKSLFIPAGGVTNEDKLILAAINNIISENVEYWGGSCSRYEADCVPTTCGPAANATCKSLVDSKTNALTYPQVTSASQSYLIRVCEEILEVGGTQSRAVSNLLASLSLDTAKPIDSVNIKLVMSYVYRDRPVTDAAVNGVVALAAEAKAKGLSESDQWRFSILPVCASSAMVHL